MSAGPSGAAQGLPRSAPLELVIDFCNRLMLGRLNAGIDLTLTANAASTTITDSRIGPNSFIGFMPRTAHASAEIGAGTIYVVAATQIKGSAVITHANNSQTDRVFRILIIG